MPPAGWPLRWSLRVPVALLNSEWNPTRAPQISVAEVRPCAFPECEARRHGRNAASRSSEVASHRFVGLAPAVCRSGPESDGHLGLPRPFQSSAVAAGRGRTAGFASEGAGSPRGRGTITGGSSSRSRRGSARAARVQKRGRIDLLDPPAGCAGRRPAWRDRRPSPWRAPARSRPCAARSARVPSPWVGPAHGAPARAGDRAGIDPERDGGRARRRSIWGWRRAAGRSTLIAWCGDGRGACAASADIWRAAGARGTCSQRGG
jgi:hypothetical protein